MLKLALTVNTAEDDQNQQTFHFGSKAKRRKT